MSSKPKGGMNTEVVEPSEPAKLISIDSFSNVVETIWEPQSSRCGKSSVIPLNKVLYYNSILTSYGIFTVSLPNESALWVIPSLS